MSRLLPGPLATMILADFGAEVIKIEEPGRGDYMRWIPPLIDGTGLIFQIINRNKKSLTLNLKSEAGREVFYRLVKQADVVVEGFRYGVAKRLGIDYEHLCRLNPRLIYCALTGYGQTGPYRSLAGHDLNYLGYSGILGLTRSEKGTPVIPGAQIADVGGGSLPAVIGILLALRARELTGRGQLVDIAMLDGLFFFLPMMNAATSILRGGLACYNVYRTSDDQYISLGILEEHFWQRLCQHLGCPQYIPLQFDPESQAQIRAHLAQIFATRTRDEWLAELIPLDVCAGPVYQPEEVWMDPQVRERELVEEKEYPAYGRAQHLGFPVKLKDTPAALRFPAPLLGQHSEEILREVGYSAQEIEKLRQQGVI